MNYRERDIQSTVGITHVLSWAFTVSYQARAKTSRKYDQRQENGSYFTSFSFIRRELWNDVLDVSGGDHGAAPCSDCDAPMAVMDGRAQTGELLRWYWIGCRHSNGGKERRGLAVKRLWLAKGRGGRLQRLCCWPLKCSNKPTRRHGGNKYIRIKKVKF